MKLITLYVPEPYLKKLDQLIEAKRYPNRAEAIRIAIRDLANEETEMLRYMDSKCVFTELLEGVPSL